MSPRATSPRFVADYRLDGTGWAATVESVPLSARGRTLESARIAMVDAIAEHFDVVPAIVVLSDNVILGPDVDQLVAAAVEARDVALAASEQNRVATAAAAIAARDRGVSLRDTAHLLGLSHSRIQQILDTAADERPTREHA